MGFKPILHIDKMKIKTKDMIRIKIEIIKVKSDTIYELFPWYDMHVYHFYFRTFFFKFFQFIKFLSTLVLIMT